MGSCASCRGICYGTDNETLNIEIGIEQQRHLGVALVMRHSEAPWLSVRNYWEKKAACYILVLFISISYRVKYNVQDLNIYELLIALAPPPLLLPQSCILLSIPEVQPSDTNISFPALAFLHM